MDNKDSVHIPGLKGKYKREPAAMEWEINYAFFPVLSH